MSKFTLLSNDGKKLGMVRYASANNLTVYNISDIFGALNINRTYATRIQKKYKLARYLYADWQSIVCFIKNMRSQSFLTIEICERLDPRIAPVDLDIQFAESPIIKFLKTLDDNQLVAVVDNLDRLVTKPQILRAIVSDTVYRNLRKFDFESLLNLPACHIAELVRPARARLEEQKKIKEKPEPPKPLAVDVKDGKLVIELTIAGIHTQK